MPKGIGYPGRRKKGNPHNSGGGKRTPMHGHDPVNTKAARALRESTRRGSAAPQKGTKAGNVRTGRADR